jgi:hypothetical protein
MQAVKITEMDSHTIITGSNRLAVENTISALVAQGGRLIESVKELGNNWIATVERANTGPVEWCEVTNIGLQIVIEGSSLAVVKARIDELSTYGAIIVAGPEQVEQKWVAVLDERATKSRHG